MSDLKLPDGNVQWCMVYHSQLLHNPKIVHAFRLISKTKSLKMCFFYLTLKVKYMVLHNLLL